MDDCIITYSDYNIKFFYRSTPRFKCCVTWCKNVARNTNPHEVSYHGFPKQDHERRAKWTKAVRLEKNNPKWKPGYQSAICSRHFNIQNYYILEDCENKFYRTVLERGSVPICTMIGITPWSMHDLIVRHNENSNIFKKDRAIRLRHEYQERYYKISKDKREAVYEDILKKHGLPKSIGEPTKVNMDDWHVQTIEMPFCSISACKNRSDIQNMANSNISYHIFPDHPRIRKRWIEAVDKGPDWAPKKASTICSTHFDSACFVPNSAKRILYDWAIPSLKIRYKTTPICDTDVATSSNLHVDKTASKETVKSAENPSKDLLSTDIEDSDSRGILRSAFTSVCKEISSETISDESSDSDFSKPDVTQSPSTSPPTNTQSVPLTQPAEQSIQILMQTNFPDTTSLIQPILTQSIPLLLNPPKSAPHSIQPTSSKTAPWLANTQSGTQAQPTSTENAPLLSDLIMPDSIKSESIDDSPSSVSGQGETSQQAVSGGDAAANEASHPLYFLGPDEKNLMVYNIPRTLNIMPIYHYSCDVPKGPKNAYDATDIFGLSIAKQIKKLPLEHATVLKGQIQKLISDFKASPEKSNVSQEVNVATPSIAPQEIIPNSSPVQNQTQTKKQNTPAHIKTIKPCKTYYLNINTKNKKDSTTSDKKSSRKRSAADERDETIKKESEELIHMFNAQGNNKRRSIRTEKKSVPLPIIEENIKSESSQSDEEDCMLSGEVALKEEIMDFEIEENPLPGLTDLSD